MLKKLKLNQINFLFNSICGGWGLYDLSDRGIKCVPAYKFDFRIKRKRKIIVIDCEDVIDIKILHSK